MQITTLQPALEKTLVMPKADLSTRVLTETAQPAPAVYLMPLPHDRVTFGANATLRQFNVNRLATNPDTGEWKDPPTLKLTSRRPFQVGAALTGVSLLAFPTLLLPLAAIGLLAGITLMASSAILGVGQKPPLAVQQALLRTTYAGKPTQPDSPLSVTKPDKQPDKADPPLSQKTEDPFAALLDTPKESKKRPAPNPDANQQDEPPIKDGGHQESNPPASEPLVKSTGADAKTAIFTQVTPRGKNVFYFSRN